MSVPLTLSTPVTAHGDEVTALELRPPTGKDLRTCGVPFSVSADESLTFLAEPMSKMIAELAQVPPSTVNALSAQDWMAAATVVMGFFGAAPPKVS